jgi:hypothetical protein
LSRAKDGQLDLVASVNGGKRGDQVAGAANRRAGECDDHISRAQARLGCGRA